jgi:hypothetical protein
LSCRCHSDHFDAFTYNLPVRSQCIVIRFPVAIMVLCIYVDVLHDGQTQPAIMSRPDMQDVRAVKVGLAPEFPEAIRIKFSSSRKCKATHLSVGSLCKKIPHP